MSLLIIRADASSEIGTGHIMRMLALAQACEDRAALEKHDAQNKIVFVCAEIPASMANRLRDEGFLVEIINAKPGSHDDLVQTVATVGTYQESESDTWVVTDGYAFDLSYQRGIREAGFRLTVVDDYNHLPAYDCDMLLNQNIGAENTRYNLPAESRQLLGTRFSMLRREFRDALKVDRGQTDVSESCCNILVTMGGADLHRVTVDVLGAFANYSDSTLHIKAVVGAAYSDPDALAEIMSGSKHRLDVLHNVQDMVPVMQWSDLAVTAGGSTCWELLALGVPLMAIVLAENQADLVGELARRDVASNLGWHHEFAGDVFLEAFNKLSGSKEIRRAMIERGRELVDGFGCDRILSVLSSEKLFFRPALATDMRWWWNLSNDSGSRAASFHSDSIPWDDHVQWFGARLRDKNTCMMVAEANGRAVGVIRFDSKGDAPPVVSVAVEPGARGKGFGTSIIREGTRTYAADSDKKEIIAYIKPGNPASIRSFESSGYEQFGETTINGETALSFVWRS